MVKRDYIISKAAQMFETQGIKSVRIDDIATQLGMSKRTLYEMFGNKEELLKECMNYIFLTQHLDKWNQSLAASPNILATISYMTIQMRRQKNQRERNERMRDNLMKFYPAVFNYIEERLRNAGKEHLHRIFERGLDEGVFRKDTRIDLSIAILANTMLLISMNKIKLSDNISQDEAFEYLILNFFRGISTVKGVELIDEYYEQYKESESKDGTDYDDNDKNSI